MQILILTIGIISVFSMSASASVGMQKIDGFLIDRTEVTVRQFREFVDGTGYITAEEKRGGGLGYGAGW